MASAETPENISETQFWKSLQRIALYLSRERKAEELYDLPVLDKVPSSDEEMKRDWHNATVFMATNVLTATLRLSDLDVKCFPCIESVWLSECKETIAYFAWFEAREEVGVWCDPHVKQNHYFEACTKIRKLVVEHRSKDRLENFVPIRDYICCNYLDEFRRVNGEHSDELIHTKVNRLVSRATPQIAAITAAEYTKKFYENIISAVEDSDRESCATVLHALQHGGTWAGFPDIINCFEAAVAISFLDAALIHDLWKSTPDLSRETTF